MWNYMGREIDPQTLPTKAEMLAFINENGMDDRALAKVREQQYAIYGYELLYRYPISEGKAAGGFVTPVREGFLWLPYDAMTREDGELLTMEEVKLLSAEECEYLLTDMRSFADELCNALADAQSILEMLEQEEAK